MTEATNRSWNSPRWGPTAETTASFLQLLKFKIDYHSGEARRLEYV